VSTTRPHSPSSPLGTFPRKTSQRASIHDDEGFARVHGRADAKVEPRIALVQLADRSSDRKRGAYGPLGIVLVAHRCAEEGDHRIADEFLDDSSVELELMSQTAVVRGEHRSHVFGIEFLAARGRANEVGEHSRDDAPLFFGDRRCRQWGAAVPAKAHSLRVFAAAR
jgi:hypothetical protein